MERELTSTEARTCFALIRQDIRIGIVGTLFIISMLFMVLALPLHLFVATAIFASSEAIFLIAMTILINRQAKYLAKVRRAQ